MFLVKERIKMFELLKPILEQSLPQETLDLLEQYLFPVTLAIVLALGFLAFYSFRVFRVMLTLGGAAAFGVIGSMVVAPLLTTNLGIQLQGISIVAAVGFVFALIGGLLAHFLYKLALFIAGAGAGYLIGSVILLPILQNSLNIAFLSSPAGQIVVPVVVAIIMAILFIFLFKFLYIVLTSVGGMALAGAFVGSSIITGMPIVLYASAAVGAIIGIFAAVSQFRRAAL